MELVWNWYGTGMELEHTDAWPLGRPEGRPPSHLAGRPSIRPAARPTSRPPGRRAVQPPGRLAGRLAVRPSGPLADRPSGHPRYHVTRPALWVGTRQPGRGGLKNCALAFDRIGAFQHNFPKATIFDSGVCEINARTKQRDKQPQSPPAPHFNVGCFARPHGLYKNGRLFRTRTDPPLGPEAQH